MEQLPSGTVTLLFSDIESSTLLLSRLGDAYAEVLDAHRTILRASWRRWGGVERGTEGDSFFVVFATAQAAVSAAAEAQRNLTAQAWPKGEDVRVRIGIHTGSPMLHGEDYVGLDVHRAARIAAAAHGGQVVLSSSTVELVSGSLPDGAEIHNLGVHRLKDIVGGERLAQLTLAGLASDFPPLKSLGTEASLPVPATQLVGRDVELAELMTLLDTQDVRLVTLTGPGGSGKTRLALAMASRRASAPSESVYFVPLAAVTEASSMWATIAEALGFPPHFGGRSALLTHLAQQKAVMVLDNLEQLIGAEDVVKTLLAGAPGLTVVATSRRPLHLAGEHEHPVPSLDLPGTLEFEDAQQAGAVQLFVEYAQMVRPSFVLDRENVVPVSAICRRLDGLPLGIELAAARIKLLSPSALLARLVHTLDLRSLDATRPSRQQTLQAAIGWSYELLDVDLQRFFRSLGVFAGSATLDAIAAVTDAGDDVIELVGQLQDVSLAVVSETIDGEPRVALLETISEYAMERLTEAGAFDRISNRHAQYYCSTVIAKNEPDLRTARHQQAIQAVELEHSNIVRALEWAFADERESSTLPARLELGVRICGELTPFWYQRAGFLPEACRWYEQAIAKATTESTFLAAVLAELGVSLVYRAKPTEEDFVRAHQYLLRASHIYMSSGEQFEGRVITTANRGYVFALQGDFSQARSMIKDAVTFAEEADDNRARYDAFAMMCSVEMEADDCFAAAKAARVARDLAKRAGYIRGFVTMTQNMTACLLELRRFPEALTELKDAIRYLPQLGDVQASYYGMATLSVLYAELGEHALAVRLAGTADRLEEQVAPPRGPRADADFYKSRFSKTRQFLTDAEWDLLIQQGRALTVEEVVAEIVGMGEH